MYIDVHQHYDAIMAKQKNSDAPARYELGRAPDNDLADLSEGYKGAQITRYKRTDHEQESTGKEPPLNCQRCGEIVT